MGREGTSRDQKKGPGSGTGAGGTAGPGTRASPFPSVPDASWRCRMDLEPDGGHRWLSALPPATSARGRGWGRDPHQTTGKRIAPQQMRSTKKRISFQSM